MRSTGTYLERGILEFSPDIAKNLFFSGSVAAGVFLLPTEEEYFGLSFDEAKRTAGVVGAAVSGWRKEAGALGLNKAAIDRMVSAFEHADLEQALRFNAAA